MRCEANAVSGEIERREIGRAARANAVLEAALHVPTGIAENGGALEITLERLSQTVILVCEKGVADVAAEPSFFRDQETRAGIIVTPLVPRKQRRLARASTAVLSH